MDAVSVLFADRRSIYKNYPVDVWDADRDALKWPGGNPAIAHPPCAQWGPMRGLAKNIPHEKAMGPWAIEQIKIHGGIVEHPAHSKLWAYMGLPDPAKHDGWGWTLPIQQKDWNHPATKNTWLYIVGLTPAQLPPIPLNLREPTHHVSRSRGKNPKPNLEGRHRAATPQALAEWLIEACRAITR